MQGVSDRPISLRSATAFFYKYRRRLVYNFCIPILLSLVIALFYTPRYQVETVLSIHLGAEYVYQPEIGNNQTGNNNPIPFSDTQIFKTEEALLSSRDLHAQVIRDMGIETIFPEIFEPSMYNYLHNKWNNLLISLGINDRVTPEEEKRLLLARAVDKFEKRLDVTLQKESSVIIITFENKNPFVAVDTLNHLLAVYFAKRKEIYQEDRSEAAEKAFSASRLRVITAEKQLGEFRKQHNIHDFTEQRKEILARRDKALEQASFLNNTGLEARISGYNYQLAALAESEHELDIRQKDLDLAREAYSLYSYRRNEARTAEDINQQKLKSVHIIEEPLAPAEPRMWRIVIMLCGVFTGILCAAITASWKYASNDTVHDKQDIFTLIGNSRNVISLDYYPSKMPDTLHSIDNIPTRQGLIAFISARSGEGTSFVAFRYAESLAYNQKQTKILLLDAGQLNASNYSKYGFIPQHTLAETGDIADAFYWAKDNLALARLGKATLHDNNLWQQLRLLFDVIIIDAGSLHYSLSAAVLAAYAEATMLVVEADKTRIPVIRNCYDTLISAGASIESVILNKKKHYIPEAIYKKL